ncbi:hypothetical protein ACLOJK_006918 [Asimina triloba]
MVGSHGVAWIGWFCWLDRGLDRGCIEHDGGQQTLEPGLGVNGQKGRRSSDGRMTMGISFASLDRAVEDEDGSIWGQGVGC